MDKMYLSQSVMLGVTFFALSSGGNMLAFIDIPALVIVFVFALLFSIADTKSIKTRVRNFSDVAVLGGWVGALIGAICYSIVWIRRI